MSTPPSSFAELLVLREAVDVEFKQAQGQQKLGEVPSEFWPSYSSMANTDGGLIVLGVKERTDGSLDLLGLTEVDRVRSDLWNMLNNRQKISANLLREADVQVLREDGKALLLVQVPRATRQQRPVYVGRHPLEGTYRRNHSGDYLAQPDEVRRMLAEAEGEGAADSRILPKYTVKDLNTDTLKAYRNAFKTSKPDHPWLALGTRKLLEKLGGWRRDRDTEEEGLTVAGLLMFSEAEQIQEVIPGYLLDYRETDPAQPDVRWVDRLMPDGTWSGNVYDFYRQVYRRLVSGLKVPFRLRDGQRIDDTPVHEALREALANALSHADYWGSGGVVVLKEQDGFSFRNPGTLRLPLEQVLEGGHTDPRNISLHKMFLMVGAGERAGSGIPKILGAWEGQHWRIPNLLEGVLPDTVSLKLTMQSLLPESSLAALHDRFGEEFDALSHDERLALVTADVEDFVTNERLQGITRLHSADITRLLADLTNRQMLHPEGKGRWMKYRLPHNTGDTDSSQPNLWQMTDALPHDGPLTPQDPSPVQHDVAAVPQDQVAQHGLPLLGKRASRDAVQEAILVACQTNYMTLVELAERLGRSPETLRSHYLPDMVLSGQLLLLYPDTPTRKGQAYRAALPAQQEPS
jgi:ATP-dependent DNA helicase RecG